MFMAGHVSMWRVSLGQNGWAGLIESEKKTSSRIRQGYFSWMETWCPVLAILGQCPPPPSALLTCPWVPLLPAAQAPTLPVPSLGLGMTNDNSQLGWDR